MIEESNRSPEAAGDGRSDPRKTGIGSTRFPLFHRGVVIFFAAGLAVLAWLAGSGRLEEGPRMQRIPGEPGRCTRSCAFSADATRVAMMDFDGNVALWDARGGWRNERLPGRSGTIRSLSLSPDAHFLACADQEPGILLHDLQSRGEPRRLPVPLDRVLIVAFAPDGRTVAASDWTGRIVLWDLAAGRVRWRVRAPGCLTSLAFAPDGRSMASSGFDPRATIILWDLETGRPTSRIRPGERNGPVIALALSPDGRLLASASAYERRVRLWDSTSARLIRSIEGHSRGASAIAFAPDGTTLATVGNDGAARLWAVATGRQEAVLDGDAFALCGVAFSPDGRWLTATARDDHHIRRWELLSNQRRGIQAGSPWGAIPGRFARKRRHS